MNKFDLKCRSNPVIICYPTPSWYILFVLIIEMFILSSQGKCTKSWEYHPNFAPTRDFFWTNFNIFHCIIDHFHILSQFGPVAKIKFWWNFPRKQKYGQFSSLIKLDNDRRTVANPQLTDYFSHFFAFRPCSRTCRKNQIWMKFVKNFKNMANFQI